MATPVFCCGFEEGVAGVHWNIGTPTFTTSSPISGTRSLRCNATGSNSFAQTIAAFGVGIIVLRFKVKFTSLPTTDIQIGGVLENFRGVWFKVSDSTIVNGDSLGVAATGGFAVTTGVVYYVDLRLNTTGVPEAGIVVRHLSVNGTSCGTRADVDVAATAPLQVVVGFTDNTTADALFDDVLVSATSDDYPLGDGYVNHFVPTADGTHNIAGAADFKRGAAGVDITNSITDSYLLVDDVPMDAVGVAPTANDYINAIAPVNATDYTENLFGPAPGISAPTLVPRAVEVAVETAQAATQAGSFKLALNDNGTLDTIKEQVGVSGVVAVAAASKHYATAPTGGAWVIGGGGNGDFTDLRIRFYSADPAPDQYFVAAMIEAEFSTAMLPKNLIAIGSTSYMDDLRSDPPSEYKIGSNITETASSVVTATISSATADGEVPQQQCVIESQGGGDLGDTDISPGIQVDVELEVAGANTEVGLTGRSEF